VCRLGVGVWEMDREVRRGGSSLGGGGDGVGRNGVVEGILVLGGRIDLVVDFFRLLFVLSCRFRRMIVNCG
jgi:hypothetical protein